MMCDCCTYSSDAEADKGGAAALQRGGGDAERPAAPQHCTLLRLLEVYAEGAKVHPPSHRAHDIGNSKDVRYATLLLRCTLINPGKQCGDRPVGLFK